MIEQGTPEWFGIRRGKATASRVADLMRKTKSGWGASRKNYMAELTAERLTGETADGFTSPAMQWGTDTEPQARAAYVFFREVQVEEVGFAVHPRIEMFGASPDGLVGKDGLVEFKCPNTATHIQTLLTGSVKADYVVQMEAQMACTGRAWCDFVSFDPRLPPEMQLFIRRYEARSESIERLEGMVVEFLDELDQQILDLNEKYGGE